MKAALVKTPHTDSSLTVAVVEPAPFVAVTVNDVCANSLAGVPLMLPVVVSITRPAGSAGDTLSNKEGLSSANKPTQDS